MSALGLICLARTFNAFKWVGFSSQKTYLSNGSFNFRASRGEPKMRISTCRGFCYAPLLHTTLHRFALTTWLSSPKKTGLNTGRPSDASLLPMDLRPARPNHRHGSKLYLRGPLWHYFAFCSPIRPKQFFHTPRLQAI